MKKRLFIILGILVIIIVLVIGLTNITKSFDDENEGVLLTDEHKWFLSEPTMEFTGKSEHFSFSTGKVVLGANTKQGEVYNYLYYDDFIQTKKIDNLSYVSLIRYLGNDKMIFKKIKPKLNEKIKSFGFLDTAIVSSTNDQFEVGNFSYATKDNFTDMLKLEIEYCVKGNKCYTEKLEINYK